jgi:hypothetical protein
VSDAAAHFLTIYTNAVRMQTEDWDTAQVLAATRRRWPAQPHLPVLEQLARQALLIGWRAAAPLDFALASRGGTVDLSHELQPLIAAAQALVGPEAG